MEQVPIFIINLDESRDRYGDISGRLSDLGLEFERVPAIKGTDMSRSEMARVNPWRPWRYARTNAEVGCYASHLKALMIVSDRRLPRAIILEDDAIFDADFADFAHPRYPLPHGTDILKLEGFDFSGKAVVPFGVASPDRRFAFLTTPSSGSAAYLITLVGAQKALRRLTAMKDQFDSDLFRYWQTGITTYDVIPYPVRQNGADTTIPGRKKNRLPPLRRFALNIFRAPVKRYDKAKRRKETERRLVDVGKLSGLTSI